MFVLERKNVYQQSEIVKSRFNEHINLIIHLIAGHALEQARHTIELSLYTIALFIEFALKRISDLHEKRTGDFNLWHIGNACTQLEIIAHWRSNINAYTRSSDTGRDLQMVEIAVIND